MQSFSPAPSYAAIPASLDLPRSAAAPPAVFAGYPVGCHTRQSPFRFLQCNHTRCMPPAFPLSDADLHTMDGFQSSAAAPLCFGTVLCTPILPASRCLKMLGSRKAGVQNTPAFKHHRKRHLLHRLRPVFLRQHYLYQVLRVKTVRFTLRPPRPPHFQE